MTIACCHRSPFSQRGGRLPCRNVTYVITDVIGYNGGVARVVLWYAKLNLTGEVGTDVSCFSKNTASSFSKESERAYSKREPRRIDASPNIRRTAATPKRQKPTTARPITAPPRNPIINAGLMPFFVASAAREFEESCDDNTPFSRQRRKAQYRKYSTTAKRR